MSYGFSFQKMHNSMLFTNQGVLVEKQAGVN